MEFPPQPEQRPQQVCRAAATRLTVLSARFRRFAIGDAERPCWAQLSLTTAFTSRSRPAMQPPRYAITLLLATVLNRLAALIDGSARQPAMAMRRDLFLLTAFDISHSSLCSSQTATAPCPCRKRIGTTTTVARNLPARWRLMDFTHCSNSSISDRARRYRLH